MSKKVAIIMGSDSDLPVVKAAISELKAFGVPSEVHVMSAHRTPELVAEFATNAKKNGFGVIIAAAGKAAHLAGVIAGHTTLPGIGIPIKSSTLDGLDALLAGAANAAILAVQMLALSDDALAEQLVQRKKTMAEGVVEKEKKLLAQLEA